MIEKFYCAKGGSPLSVLDKVEDVISNVRGWQVAWRASEQQDPQWQESWQCEEEVHFG